MFTARSESQNQCNDQHESDIMNDHDMTINVASMSQLNCSALRRALAALHTYNYYYLSPFIDSFCIAMKPLTLHDGRA